MGTLLTLAAATPVHASQSNFTVGDVVHATTATASTSIYRAVHPGTNTLRMGVLDTQLAATQKVIHIAGDGTTTTFAHTAYPALSAAHVDGGTLAVADNLRVIVQEIGSRNQVLRTLVRVAASATPTDGQFKTSGAVTLTVGAALAEGAYFRVLILGAADIVTEAVTQYLPTRVTVGDFMIANNATVLERF